MRSGRHSWPCNRGSDLVSIALGLATLVGCSSDGVDPTGPGPGPGDPPAVLLALHSVGQTMQGYEAGEVISPSGGAIDLGGLFDGDAMAVGGAVTDLTAVVTESSFGGDRALVVDVAGRRFVSVGFPDEPANPSKPFVVESRGSAFVGGRASNAVYELSITAPGTQPAVFARDVGEFIEKVVVANDRVFVIDSNIDDVGFTFEPLGNSRVVVFETSGEFVREIELPGLQATDAVLSAGRLVVLNAGTLDPAFVPEGNGSLAVIDPTSLQLSGPFLLAGNGVSIEDGADGRVYVSVTSDFVSIRTLRFDPAGPGFLDGPESPIQTEDADGAQVSCWATTALSDGRLVCATFRSEQVGELLLLSADGGFIDSTPGGFGTTDLEIVASQP
jgi:hypothetical protein